MITCSHLGCIERNLSTSFSVDSCSRSAEIFCRIVDRDDAAFVCSVMARSLIFDLYMSLIKLIRECFRQEKLKQIAVITDNER
jgi:hypothetical protein